jgi:acyl-CoA dehydrogenase family protein 10
MLLIGGIFRELSRHSVRQLRVAVVKCRSFSDGPDKSKRPKLVVFDLGGVVLQSPIPAITKFEAESGVPAGSIFSAAKKKGDGGAFPRLERGELTLEEFIPEFRKEISEAGVVLKKDVADMFVAMEAGFAPPRPEMLLAIQSLKAEGIRTAALTNNWKRNNGATLPPSLASTMKLFDVVVESALVGLRKPDPKIYSMVLDKSKVRDPTQAVMLDDIGANLKAAAAIGMDTIRVEDDYMQALTQLESKVGFKLQEFVPGTVSVRPHLKIDTAALGNFMAANSVPGEGTVSQIRQFGHGQSNPTYHVTRASGHQLVLRKKPPGKILKGAHAVEREFAVIKALGNASFPVAKAHVLCEDESVLGTPFYLMDYCDGRLFKNPHLPGLSGPERAAVYDSMNEVLGKLHKVDIGAAGLTNYGKSEGFYRRQIATWSKQYESSKTPDTDSTAMEGLVIWLQANIPPESAPAVVHGDFRLDNLIFSPDLPHCQAVLDWELSTVGDPIADLAYNCLVYYLPPQFPQVPGFAGVALPEGVPTEEEYVKAYLRRTGRGEVLNWHFYLSFSFFRIAAILQGVYKRALQGNASSDQAKQVGALASMMAQAAVDLSRKPRNIAL